MHCSAPGDPGEHADWNPRNIKALVIVDMDPSWVYDHTVTSPNNHSIDNLVMGHAADIASFLAHHAREHDLPILPLHTEIRRLYDLHSLSGTTVAVCGVYGGQCVQEAINWLESRWAIQSVQIVDAIVWPSDEEPRGETWRSLFPECQVEEWACVTVEQLTSSC